MIPLNIEALKAHLDGKGLKPELQKETNQVFILLKLEEVEFPIFFRIFEPGKLLQVMSFIPTELKKSAAADTARILHLFNKELDIPGFGMDEVVGAVYYRCMIPCEEAEVGEKMFDAFVQATEQVVRAFAPPINAVAQGLSTYDEVLKRAEEMKKEMAKKG